MGQPGRSLVSCPSFVIEAVHSPEGTDQQIPPHQPVVRIMLEGRGLIGWNGAAESIEFSRGDVVLLPAALSDPRVKITAPAQWLEVTVPVPGDPANPGQ